MRLCQAWGCELHDLGPVDHESVDYPVYAQKLAEAMGEGDGGVLLCGTGLGMSIAINRYPHIRGGLCHNTEQAQKSRQHNDTNVLVLAADHRSDRESEKILKAWYDTPFERGRHDKRVSMINRLARPFWLSSRYDREGWS